MNVKIFLRTAKKKKNYINEEPLYVITLTLQNNLKK